MPETNVYLVKLTIGFNRNEYVVLATGYDEAAKKAQQADTVEGENPPSVKSIELYGDRNSVIF